MATRLKMPALSPTMEHGTLAKWLKKEGDAVAAGDIIAEIETDKATMEFEAIDDGVLASILVPAGAENIAVGTDIAIILEEGETLADLPAKTSVVSDGSAPAPPPAQSPEVTVETTAAEGSSPILSAPIKGSERMKASPLARRIAAEKGVDLSGLAGSGPNGRIVKADVDVAEGGQIAAAPAAPISSPAAAPTPAPAAAIAPVQMADETRKLLDPQIPHAVEKLSGMRKTIAKRLSSSMQEAPHIYLTVDIQLDRLLAMRTEMNAALEKRGVKLSVNDMLIKALGKALVEVPECNVTFAGNEMIKYSRADVSVAVSIPGGLITPIVRDADGRSVASIATAMKDLGQRAKEGKLKADEYQGGTASLSNMGMMGIKHFTAVINPPQATILAIGAGEKRPHIINDALGIATMMTATGSFDHRAVDGADGARLMAAFKEFVQNPLGMLA